MPGLHCSGRDTVTAWQTNSNGLETRSWPAFEVNIDARTGDWTARVTVGQDNEVLGLITVNEQEHAKLQTYLQDAVKTGNFKPIKMPPTTAIPKILTGRKPAN